MSRRRAPLEHVLIAGDSSEIDAIRALLALLPSTTYGQVYVETISGTVLPEISAPRRVTVTMLPRDAADLAGERLASAVDGWLAEWIPEEPEPDRDLTIWLGEVAGARVETSATCLERL
ncbi:hypothetical protein GCM10011519_00430 [Marmoricola endophyticus]|uniref:SIP-like Rossmann fold domain-containing protein n=1 Tax=Marmoricola endophyticus TaxID=2040280 RepID=A0A917B9P2_9ACTN|nr:SIP domain-containing protein [Marmoricola endophyticus]GGF30927.1 hypothetical protein GCM10011519_00430 [Marmoricola endophyticus]